MGQQVVAAVLAAADLELCAAYERPDSEMIGWDAGIVAGGQPCGVAVGALDDGIDCDVLVDFSLPAGLAQALDLLTGQALVTGTTSVPADTVNRLVRYSTSAPVVVAANFSTGITLLLDLAARAAGALADFDVEIVETHHRHKRDAPSGTALALGRAVAAARHQDLDQVACYGRHGETGERPAGEIAFHALRGGEVIGEHTLVLAGAEERVVLGHIAASRATFAAGSVRAARWVVEQPPGRYTMRDVLGLS